MGENHTGRLDRAPAPGAVTDRLAALGRRYFVFVDTEEEFDWTLPHDRHETSTSAVAALPAAHAHIAASGVAPVYLVDYPIVDNADSAAILRDLIGRGDAGIGAQLHAWVTPPFEETVSRRNSFVGNLPVDLERAKLAALTDRIETALGVRPACYRSGRYGVGPATAGLLEEQGYRLDLSVRSLYDYSADGGPDFTHHPIEPYVAGPTGKLVVLPLTSTYLGALRQHGKALLRWASRVPHGPGLFARSGLVERISLTPEGIPVDRALEAIRQLDGDGLQLFSLSYHSPSVVPGHTPYVRTEADLAAFYRWWDAVLGLFAQLGIAGGGLDDLIDAIETDAAQASATSGG